MSDTVPDIDELTRLANDFLEAAMQGRKGMALTLPEDARPEVWIYNPETNQWERDYDASQHDS